MAFRLGSTTHITHSPVCKTYIVLQAVYHLQPEHAGSEVMLLSDGAAWLDWCSQTEGPAPCMALHHQTLLTQGVHACRLFLHMCRKPAIPCNEKMLDTGGHM